MQVLQEEEKMKKNILVWALIFLVGVLIGRFINPSKRLLNLQGITLDEVFNIKYELNKLHVTLEEFMETENRLERNSQ